MPISLDCFLPKIMSSLDERFGENAELSEDEENRIRSYLSDNTADHSNSRISINFMHSLRGQIPLRISGIPCFVKEHNELSRKMVQDNPKVELI